MSFSSNSLISWSSSFFDFKFIIADPLKTGFWVRSAVSYLTERPITPFQGKVYKTFLISGKSDTSCLSAKVENTSINYSNSSLYSNSFNSTNGCLGLISKELRFPLMKKSLSLCSYFSIFLTGELWTMTPSSLLTIMKGVVLLAYCMFFTKLVEKRLFTCEKSVSLKKEILILSTNIFFISSL